jgi:hypothetical protein
MYRSLALSLALLTSMLFTYGQAQVPPAYETAVIRYELGGRSMHIAIDGKEFLNQSVPKEMIQSKWDLNPALAEVSKLVDAGWELFNTTTHSYGTTVITEVYSFYLRRPKK